MIEDPLAPEGAIVVRARARIWTVNAERRGMHWRERNELITAVRWSTKINALEEKIPTLVGRVAIVARPLQSRRGPAADPGGYAGAVKAAIDGLRDARVLTDDTDEYVSTIEHLPSLRVEARDVGLQLYLTPSEPQQ